MLRQGFLPSKAAAKAASITKVSSRYVETAKHVKRLDSALFERVKAGEMTLQQAKEELKRKGKTKLAAKLNAEPIPLPEGAFNVIVLDPPWRYEARSQDCTHRARSPYPDLSIEEILALPVSEKAGQDCILWLWTTNAFMREAFACLDKWGFEQKTILTWVKDRMGLGDWLRGQSEHCLMAIRGKPIVMLTNQSTVLCGEARQHSRKPESFFELVESLCPGTKCDWYGRQARPGWVVIGAEAAKFSSEE
jgi:N6-adenosine-specific RNA methylase IME4